MSSVASSQEQSMVCDASVVDESCSLLLEAAPSGSLKDALQTRLSAEEAQMAPLWAALSKDSVTCQELCGLTMELLAKEGIPPPPATDVICYYVRDELKCDDSSTSTDGTHLVPDGEDLPDMHDKFHGSDLSEDGASMTIPYTMLELAVRVANLFRIYPALHRPIVADMSGGRISSFLQTVGGDVSKLNSSDVHEEVLERKAAEASKAIADAIRLYHKPGTDKYVKKWFGKYANEDSHVATEIQRVLNSVVHVLAKPVFIYPAPDCDEDTYAFVEPKGRVAKDRQGRYQMFMCDLFFREPRSQVSTLTHEASHHATAYTDDVCLDSVGKRIRSENELRIIKYKRELRSNVHVDDEVEIPFGDKGFVIDATVYQIKDNDEVILLAEPPHHDDCDEMAYGKATCIDLARKSPIKALRNADNFCFFIDDVIANA